MLPMVYIVPRWSSFRALQLLGLGAHILPCPVLDYVWNLWTRISLDNDLPESWDDFESTALFTSHWHSLTHVV